MQLGTRGLNLIKSYEQLRLKAYKPTPNDVWTCGYGHTKGVTATTTCTEVQAENWLSEDCADAVKAVSRLPNVKTQSMFDALVSLTFNAGPGAVGLNSTIGRAFQAGNAYAAWAGFALWRKQAGRDLLGLARRRAQEMVLFLEDGL